MSSEGHSVEKAPAAARAASPRERILRVAQDLFYRHGVHTVGIDRIIAESGVAKMTFYRYFPSKSKLVAEYLGSMEAGWRSSLDCRLTNAGLTAEEKLLLIFDALHDSTRCEAFRGCAFIKSLAEFGPETEQPEIQRAVQAHFDRMEKDITELLKAIRPQDYAKLVEPVLSLILGTMVLVQAGGRKDAALRNKEVVRTMIGRGK